MNHYGGVSPAWPIVYADIEPYYTEAERLYLVHGQAGEDPTEPSRSGPFPYPAVSHEPRIQQLHDDFERTGHNPFHLPVGVDLDETDPEAGRCVRCDRFDGFPCLTDGKADAHVLLRAPGAQARERHAEDPRAGGAARDRRRAAARSPGWWSTAAAPPRPTARDIVVVSCGAAESPALLLRSANDRSTRTGWPTRPTRWAATTWPTSTRA